MLTTLGLVGTTCLFYFMMNRLLCRWDDGYWFKKPKRTLYKPPAPQHNKSQQEHKESTETPKGTE